MVLVPDSVAIIQDSPPPVTALNDTGTKFLFGLSDRGPVTGPLDAGDALHSYADWETKHGVAQSYNANEAACVRRHFDEGGSVLFFSRYAGPSATKAAATATQFTVAGKGPGAGYAGYKVGVTSGVASVKNSANAIVEQSPTLATVADLQTWATQFSELVDITPSISAALANQADVTLAGGSDDRTNATDTERTAAIGRFAKGLGPGQVCSAGDGRSAIHAIQGAHAVATNRIALCDPPDTATAATITALGTAIRALGRETARRCILLGDWLVTPGTATGTTQLVPPSAIYSGLCARIDAAGNPNKSVAGRDAYSRTALGVHYTRTDPDLQAFADAGVVPFLIDGGLVMPYDDITPVDSVVDPEWWEASTNRFWMRVIQDVKAIGKSFMWNPVTGTVDYAAYQGAVSGYLAGWLGVALYGDTAAAAFRVDTGPSVNTPDTINQKKLRVAIGMHTAPNVRFAEAILSNIPIGEAL